MAEAISPVVQVVTSGPDWPAIVAGITTGVVGIAGIIGTFWQGKRGQEAANNNLLTSIAAETERLRLAEKRRVYAACLASINEMIPVLVEYRGLRDTDDANSRQSAWRETLRARTTLNNVVGEVELIAPEDIAERAREAVAYFWEYTEETSRGVKLGDPLPPASEVFIKLRKAMRADLGEPV